MTSLYRLFPGKFMFTESYHINNNKGTYKPEIKHFHIIIWNQYNTDIQRNLLNCWWRCKRHNRNLQFLILWLLCVKQRRNWSSVLKSHNFCHQISIIQVYFFPLYVRSSSLKTVLISFPKKWLVTSSMKSPVWKNWKESKDSSLFYHIVA